MKKQIIMIGILMFAHAQAQHGPYAQQVKEMIGLMRTAAQQEILPNFGKVTGEQGEHKTNLGFRDLVTSVDKGVSQFILDRVRDRFPGSYSEEHKFPDRFDHDLIWQLDPVDGTQEFCEGYAEGYTSLAALLKKQADGSFLPVAGVIYRPYMDHLWYNDGSNNIVFLKNGKEQPLPTYKRTKIIGYQRKVDNFKHLDTCYQSLTNNLKAPYQIIQCGGAGAGIADLLEGKINLIIFNSNISKDWDIAMAVPMIKALGGFICDFDGNPFTSYNNKNSEGLNDPHLLRGYVISLVFTRDEIIPNLPKGAFDDRLTKRS